MTATMKLLTDFQLGYFAFVSTFKPIYNRSIDPLLYTSLFGYLRISTFLAIWAIFFASCGSDANQVSNQGLSVDAQNSNGRPKLYDFDMIDTTLRAVAGIKTRVCVAVQSEESAPNYSIRITKPPFNGSLTPLLSGSELCFDYTPNANFVGKDPFEFSVCNTSGYCLDKIWFVEVNGKKVNARPTTVKANPTIETSVVPSDNSSIFDQGKKNRDNYNPNN